MRTKLNRRCFANICAQLFPQLSTVFTQFVTCVLSFVYESLAVYNKLSTVATTTSQIDNKCT